MLNKFQNIYDLCEQIIIFRQFKSLEELNIECLKIFQDSRLMLDQDFGGCLILLYYIYYIMLEEKERNIFKGIQQIIFKQNIILVRDFKILDVNDELQSKNERLLFNYAQSIIKRYMGEESIIDIDEVSSYIYYIYDNNYSAISNNDYFAYMLGTSFLDYKKLYPIAYDIFMNKLYEVCLTIINKIKYPEDEDECQLDFYEKANRMEL